MFPYWVQVVMDCYYPLCSCLEDFVSIVAKKWQQYRQNQDVYNLPHQGLTPLAAILRPVRAWCNPKTWCMILIRNGPWNFDLHLGVICNYTFISIAMNFRKVILKGHLQWPITNHLRKSYLCWCYPSDPVDE